MCNTIDGLIAHVSGVLYCGKVVRRLRGRFQFEFLEKDSKHFGVPSLFGKVIKRKSSTVCSKNESFRGFVLCPALEYG